MALRLLKCGHIPYRGYRSNPDFLLITPLGQRPPGMLVWTCPCGAIYSDGQMIQLLLNVLIDSNVLEPDHREIPS